MIIFDVSKRETHHPNANFKKLCRRLRSLGKVQVNKESISSDRLKDCDLLIIGSPQTRFVDDELRVLKDYINNGGSLAVFSSEGAAQSPESNLNELLADFGITVERTTLVRAVYHKYLHPKHALIQNGIVQPEIGDEKFTPLNMKSRSRQQWKIRNQDDGMERSLLFIRMGLLSSFSLPPTLFCHLDLHPTQWIVQLPPHGSLLTLVVNKGVCL